MPLQVFLQDLFQPSQARHYKRSLNKLKQFGGYDNLLSQLQTEQPRNNDPWKKRDGKEYLLQSFLLYLVTLSFLSKLLLYTHGVIAHLQVASESIGMVFLVVIILMRRNKAKNRCEGREDAANRVIRQYRVHRNNEQAVIDQTALRPGDILLIRPQQQLNFDAILIQVENGSILDDNAHSYLIVSEKGPDSSFSERRKYSIKHARGSQQLDPFLFRGSVVVQGSGWVVVCLAGGRQREERYNEVFEQRWMGLARAKQIAQWIKGAIAMPILGLGVEWLSETEGVHYYAFLQLLSVLSSLLLYLSYVNEKEMLWLMGRYFVQEQEGEDYKITNPKLMEQLGEVEIIVIEDREKYTCKFQSFSSLSASHDIKVITSRNLAAIQKQFNSQLADHIIYKNKQASPLKDRLDLLIKSKYVPCQFNYFCQYYLPLLQQMGFSVMLVCQRGAEEKREEKRSGEERKGRKGRRRIEDSVCVKDGSKILEVVVEIEQKSRIMRRLRNCYLCVLANSCVQLLIMTVWACCGCIVELNLNLLILYTNRDRSGNLFRAWKQAPDSCSQRLQSSWWSLNVMLVIYYLYMMGQMVNSSDRQFLLFLLLMANRLFRLQPLQPHPQRNLGRYLLRVGAVVGLMGCDAVVRRYEEGRWQVKGEWLSVLLLPLIVWLYGTFL